MKNNSKNLILTLLIIFIALTFFYRPQNIANSTKEISYSEFLNMVNPEEKKEAESTIGKIYRGDDEKFSKLSIQDNKITGWYHPTDSKDPNPKKFTTTIAPIEQGLVNTLRGADFDFQVVIKEENKFLNAILGILPWLIGISILWFIMMRNLQSTGNRAFSFGKNKAKMVVENNVDVSFQDVAGCDEAKTELAEIIDFLKDPKKFQAIGAKIPSGVLLVGPPGTGKTLMARAVAGEAKVPYFSISGSNFVEMFVGVGASRVRDLFEQAKKNNPCIIFIDEIDAVGRLRGAGLGGGHDEREQTLNQMLVEMDGFDKTESVIVIAATNRVDVLDPALLRPGRFDRQIMVDVPDVKGREDILKVHTKKVPLASDISLHSIARGTAGFTGADLANLINESALLAARHNKKRITQEELEEARDKVMMGPERKSFFISDREKEVIAYHEAGHAILGTLLPYTEPVHKVTIIPRGRALGVTQSLPTEDKHILPKKYWLDQIVVAMGGLIAEEKRFGDTSTGAANDIQQATNIARRMVCEWGMSEKLGTINYGNNNSNPFLGRDMNPRGNGSHSEQFAALIDEEVKSIVKSCLDKGRELVQDNYDKFEGIAKALLAKESIDHNELMAIVHPSNTPSADAKINTEKKEESTTTSSLEKNEVDVKQADLSMEG